MPRKTCCHTINEFPFAGDLIEVTLAVEFEVEPPEPDVGLMGPGVGCWEAKVESARLGDDDHEREATDAELLTIQAAFDELTAKHTKLSEDIDDTCLKSLDDYGDEYDGPDDY